MVKEQLLFIDSASVPEKESEDVVVGFDKTSYGEIKFTTKDDNSPLDPSVFSLLGFSPKKLTRLKANC
jgi:hypothetical protein